MRYAAQTKTSVYDSRQEIESTLSRYGAAKFAYFSEDTRACVAFELSGKRIRFLVPLPDKQSEEFQTKKHYNDFRDLTPEESAKAWEQACRQRWRALALIIKAKLEYVESGIVTIEEEFMSNIVLPNGKTVAETLVPQLDQLYRTGRIPLLLPEGIDG